jgi:hypothetical protein
MLIELGYQLFIHACSGNYYGNIVLLFSLSFQMFCVKRSGGVTGCPDGAPGCPDGDSGCLDDTVLSSKHLCSLFGWACLYDLLRGTTSRRHLSFVRMVYPVRLNRILPGTACHFLFSLLFCLSSCVFSSWFLCVFPTCSCLLCNLSPPRYVCLSFYCFILRFYT